MEENEPTMVLIPESETTCYLCYAEFLEPEDLKIHISQVHQPSRCCQLCSAPYTDKYDYAVHVRDRHLSRLSYCDKCTKVFDKRSAFKEHVKKHSDKVSKMIYCSQCSEIFGRTSELESHEYNCHMNNFDGVFLQDFFKELSSVLNMKASTFLQALCSNTALVKCVVCNYATESIDNYIKHLQKNRCRCKVCDICSNVYKNRRTLSKHIAKHTLNFLNRNVKLTKLCLLCNQEISSVLYAMHKRSCKPIKCLTCSKVFHTLQDLSEHQSKEHPAAIELKSCRFCFRQCVGEAVLQKHIEKTHKHQFPLYKYLCIHCNTPFMHPKKLFGHFFTRHKDITPYTCKICNSTFRIRKRFTLHIKLKHESKGFVEFDENYHVFFTEKKSEKPFQPRSVVDAFLKKGGDGDETVKNATETQTIENVNTVDFMDITETEGNQTEQEEVKQMQKVIRKRKRKKIENKPHIEAFDLSSSEDDQPLLKIREKSKRTIQRVNSQKFGKGDGKKRQIFTCKQCNKYCYTFQNYHYHMSLHSKNEVKKCVKCLKNFKSKAELQSHMANEHSTSKLTETLKNLLEKRKTGISTEKPELNMAQKFQMTVRKVHSDGANTPAKVKIVKTNRLSVQKFIENFTPETENMKKSINIDSCVTLKPVRGNFEKKSVIKMVKFQPAKYPTFTKLTMPVKFKETQGETTKVNIRLVNQPKTNPVFAYNETERDEIDYPEELPDDDRNDIPEAVQEVMLDAEDPKPQDNLPTLVIPKLPDGYKNVHVAHLLPEAPFYKIVKVKEGIHKLGTKEVIENDTVKLPDGTKLVTVNPLAHLLKGKPLSDVVQSKNKYYQPKQTNFEVAVAKAIQKLEESSIKKKIKKEAKSMPVLPLEQ